MSSKFIDPPEVAPPLGNTYTHAVVAGNTIYVAGQVGVDASGNVLDGFEAQATQALENLRLVLEGAGATIADVVKILVLMTDQANLGTYRALREKYLPHRPASTLFVPNALAMPQLLFEIEAVAVVDH